MTRTKQQIIVALDGMKREDALSMAWTLSSHVWGFKVNDLLFEHGLEIVNDLKCLGKVFVDPKLYDTPSTVANSVMRLSIADFITVHASGGKDMLRAALENAGDAQILAVTALTSMNDATTQQIYGKPAAETVWDLAHLAKDVGVPGIVCSSHEVNMLKHLDLVKVVPGIRFEETGERTGTGINADFIVVGRVVTKASDPIKVIRRLKGQDATGH